MWLKSLLPPPIKQEEEECATLQLKLLEQILLLFSIHSFLWIQKRGFWLFPDGLILLLFTLGL